MGIRNGFKRIKTKEFWGEVWSWTGGALDPKSIEQFPELSKRKIQSKDWLPIFTLLFLGVLFVIIVGVILSLFF